MTKTNKKSNKKEVVIKTTSDEMKKLIKVTIIVIVIFVLFWGITYFVTKKEESPNNNPKPETKIQYNEILVGEVLNQNKSEYYVLATIDKDPYVQLYNSYISIYKNNENSLNVYSCDLENVFNEKYMADESDFTIASIKDIRFKETTLIKVKNKQITNTYEGKDEIVNMLKGLID